jgi:competence protein ComGC
MTKYSKIENKKLNKIINKFKNETKNKKGISFIILVVTIIVSLILLSVVLLSIKDRNVLKQSSETKFKTNIKTYELELQDYISNKEFENNGRYNSTLYADVSLVRHEGNTVSGITIKDIIPSITNDDISNFIVYDSKLVYTGTDSIEKSWASALIEVKDISISEYAQDNLILNLDGGISPDANIWKDKSLALNDMAYLTNYTYDSANKCYTFDGGSATSLKDVSLSQNYTIEIVLSTSKYEYMNLGLNSSDLSLLLQLKIRPTEQYTFWNNGTSANWSQNYPVKQALNKKTSFVLVNDYTNSQGGIYFNNQKYSLNIENLNITSKFLIGGNLEKFSGNIYAIRVYNRALSESEILKNYELDKIRFGM